MIRKIKVTDYPRLIEIWESAVSVSYTHLDVYKRQVMGFIAAILQGVTMIPWYIVTIVKYLSLIHI